ncbi:MAG TPA: BMP family ABC transporter substrate-binding protein, partial [Caldilineaceae bacterium]|nr:BMP family ABC transporter substrate-binding protein [Caldilineaceae bacterium]
MTKKTLWMVCLWIVLLLFVVSGCSAPAAPAASSGEAAAQSTGNSQEQPVPNPADQTTDPSGDEFPTPDIVEGKFNVAFVYVGPIGDGGWTDAHNQGREYVEEQLADTVHTAYLATVPEDADAERVIRALASKGFNAIFTTSFGYMDATATVAAEFPDLYFVHISGFRKNETNFANLFGAMESMKYLAGMIAGARA